MYHLTRNASENHIRPKTVNLLPKVEVFLNTEMFALLPYCRALRRMVEMDFTGAELPAIFPKSTVEGCTYMDTYHLAKKSYADA